MDLETASLGELLGLQTQLSESLKRRFEKPLALVFSDIVGSTSYFTAHGDQAGQRLQQRHFDVIDRAVPRREGRVVSTAGDGAFLVFPSASQAALALIEVEELIARQNAITAREHRLEIRLGLHWGPVLTDGSAVTGDSVNLCARISASAGAGEIRMSKAAFSELTSDLRARCVALPAALFKGFARPVEIMRLDWLDRNRFPTRFRIKEAGPEEMTLPAQDTITFGRLREQNGIVANDVVLAAPNKSVTQQVSRWHFELRRQPEGFLLRSVTDQATEVDGAPVAKGGEAPILPRSIVRLANVMTLEFLPEPDPVTDAGDATEADEPRGFMVPE
jgi:class 3 adenylate cyclase